MKWRLQMEVAETSGRTVEDAVERALEQLGRRKDQVDVEVIRKGSKGFLGLGGEEAIVRVTAKRSGSNRNRRPTRRGRQTNRRNGNTRSEQGSSNRGNRNSEINPNNKRQRKDRRQSNREENAREIIPVTKSDEIKIPGAPTENIPVSSKAEWDDEIDLFGSTLRDLLNLLGFADTHITVRDPETAGDGLGRVNQVFDIFSEGESDPDNLAMLIGRKGETLQQLQYLTNVLVSRKVEGNSVYAIDIDGYRHRREASLTTMAKEIAEEVRTTGDVITLEPMPAALRRIVHLALEGEEGVTTQSIGKGRERQIEVMPE